MAMIHEFVLKRQTHSRNFASENDNDDMSSDRFEVEQGENWLRLLQKEGRSVLDDTQCTQGTLDESQESSTVYPSIVSLSNVGILEAPSESYYICLDLDENLLAIKDMRIPSSALKGSRGASRSAGKPAPQLGINRKGTDEWKVLSRRQLRILVPGDRICTSLVKGIPEGHILKYISREKGSQKDDVVSPSLLTQPNDGADDMSQDEDPTQSQATLKDGPSIKLEIMTNTQEVNDDDSDKTVDMSIQGISAGSKSTTTKPAFSLALSTQPESDEETDCEKENVQADVEQGSQKNETESNKEEEESHINVADTSTDRITRQPTAKDVASIQLLDDNSGEETDVEGADTIYDTAKKNATASEEIDDKKDNKSLASGSELHVSAEHVERQTSNQRNHLPAEMLNSSSSTSINGNSQNETSRIVFSPSLCGETEDPPGLNPKATAQNSESLLSPIQETETTEETVGRNSAALASPPNATDERRVSSGENIVPSLNPARNSSQGDAPPNESDDQNSVSLLEGLDIEGTKKDVKIDSNAKKPKDKQNVLLLPESENSGKDTCKDVLVTAELEKPKTGRLEVKVGSLAVSKRTDADAAAINTPAAHGDQNVDPNTKPSNSPIRVLSEAAEFDGIVPSGGDEGSDKQLIQADRKDKQQEPSSLQNAEKNTTRDTSGNGKLNETAEVGHIIPNGGNGRSDKQLKQADGKDMQQEPSNPQNAEKNTTPDNSGNGKLNETAEVGHTVPSGGDERDGKQLEQADCKDKQQEPSSLQNAQNVEQTTKPDSSGNGKLDEPAEVGHIVPSGGGDSSDKELIQADHKDKQHEPSSLQNAAVVVVRKQPDSLREEAQTIQIDEGARSSKGPAPSKKNVTPSVQESDSKRRTRSAKRKRTGAKSEEEEPINNGEGLELKQVPSENLSTNMRMKYTEPKKETLQNASIDGPSIRSSKDKQAAMQCKPVPSTPIPSQDGGARRKRTRQMSVEPVAGNDTSSLPEVESSGSRSARKRKRLGPEASTPNRDNGTTVRVITTGIELTASQKNVSASKSVAISDSCAFSHLHSNIFLVSQMVKRIGGVLLDKNIEDALAATHVIAGSKNTSMRRTPKLMIGMCKTSNIVDLEWLLQSAKQRKVLPSKDFLLANDKQAETQYRFNMHTSLMRAGKIKCSGKTLLGGFSIYCCAGVTGNKKKGNKTPPQKEFILIVEAAGATWQDSLPKKGDFSRIIVVVSKVNGEAKKQLTTKKVAEAVANGAVIKTTEEIFHGIMQQEIDF
eukprot:scaffold1669_cov129-Cylindrotheca_fusiformis.AAC.42